jgi:hypothetical protein
VGQDVSLSGVALGNVLEVQEARADHICGIPSGEVLYIGVTLGVPYLWRMQSVCMCHPSVHVYICSCKSVRDFGRRAAAACMRRPL